MSRSLIISGKSTRRGKFWFPGPLSSTTAFIALHSITAYFTTSTGGNKHLDFHRNTFRTIKRFQQNRGQTGILFSVKLTISTELCYSPNEHHLKCTKMPDTFHTLTYYK